MSTQQDLLDSTAMKQLIGQVGRVFASGTGDGVQSQVKSHQRL